ncbi:hypothetical protein Tco_0408642 [Tanacetum coccineum]
MSTFIKNQSSWKLDQIKKLTFEELKTEFEKLMKSIERFVPMETEERIKRPSEELEQETPKKQKIDDKNVPVTEENVKHVKEEEIEKSVKKRGKIRKQKARRGLNTDKTAQSGTEEREAYMKEKITNPSSGSDIGVDAIPTATKPPSIVNWKIIPQPGQKDVYQIIRVDGSHKIYMSFGAILKDFLRDDLTELYRLVIKKYGANRPEEAYDRDACQAMLNMKLQGGAKDKVCHQLLKMIEKQAGIRWSGLSLATPEQTAIGKEISNPLIANSLLKTISCDAEVDDANKDLKTKFKIYLKEQTLYKLKVKDLFKGIQHLLTPILKVWLSSPFLLGSRAANAAVIPWSIIALVGH